MLLVSLVNHFVKLVCEINRIQYIILSKKFMKKIKITLLTKRPPGASNRYFCTMGLPCNHFTAPDSNDVALVEQWAHLDLFPTNFPKNNKAQKRIFLSYTEMYYNYTAFVVYEEEKIPLVEHHFLACIKSILNKHTKSGNLVYASDDGIHIWPIVVLHKKYH